MNSWRNAIQPHIDDDACAEPPEEVTEWARTLSLLHGVPFTYLVPDEKMLPMESIRFFELDSQWVAALIDGALSVGKETTLDGMRHKLMAAAAHVSAARTIHTRRRRRMHVRHRRPESEQENASGRVSGFVMRSDLVAYWRGIEVHGYDAAAAELEIVRMERLADRILLCLFSGDIVRVEMLEPTEDLKFATKENTREVEVRSITGDVGKPIGKSIPVPADENGRVDFLKLADGIEKAIGAVKGSIGSAELALELLSVEERSEFSRK